MSSDIIFTKSKLKTIVLSGVDRHDFLQRLSTRLFKNPKLNDFFPGAFLNSNGTVHSLFHSWIRENEVFLLVEPQSAERTLAFLEKFHFSEQLKFELNSDWQWMEFRSSSISNMSALFKNQLLRLPDWPRSEKWREGLLVAEALKANFQEWDSHKWEFYQAKNFLPQDQVDIGESQIILEAGLYSHVSRNKGCYPGQEVIERLFTYGNVAKKLVLLEAAGELKLSGPSDVYLDDKKVGRVTSIRTHESQSAVLAIIQRTSARLNETYQIRTEGDDGHVAAQSVMIAPDVPKD
jgi:folate-binding protein YgfZ